MTQLQSKKKKKKRTFRFPFGTPYDKDVAIKKSATRAENMLFLEPQRTLRSQQNNFHQAAII